MSQHSTRQVGQIYDEFAPLYDRSMSAAERFLFRGGREWLCRQASGRVLEVAIGSGRNIPYYPPGTHLTGIDASAGMLALARNRAREYGCDATLIRGDAQVLPFSDQSFDTVVICLSLCTIPDDRRAIAEALRVLRPGGHLLWLEHIGSHFWPVLAVQRLLEPFSIRRHADHLTREPAKHLRDWPVDVEEVKRSRLGAVERLRASKRGDTAMPEPGPAGQSHHSP